jgi:hypothetical protein
MIECLRVLVPQIVSLAALNAQIVALNTIYGSSVTQLVAGEIFNAWTTPLFEFPRPSIGYDIGFSKDGTARLQRNGLEKCTIPIWFYVVAPANADKDAALQALGITFEALLRVIDALPPNGAEQVQMTGVTPVRAIALVQDAGIRTFTVDAEAAGKIPGIAAVFDFEVYVAQS